MNGIYVLRNDQCSMTYVPKDADGYGPYFSFQGVTGRFKATKFESVAAAEDAIRLYKAEWRENPCPYRLVVVDFRA